jgi:hypothetical protein
VYACKLGSSLPVDRPLLGSLDPKVLQLCTRKEGDRVLVVRPIDLPKLMRERESYLGKRRMAGTKGGKRSVEARKQKFGTAQPRRSGGSDVEA